MMQEWLNKINEIKLERTPEGITTVVVIAVAGLILSILLFIGLKKCIAYGESIGYGVMSFNIVLFAAPGVFILIYGFIGKFSEIPWIPLTIGWVILWLTAIIRNFINCEGITYTLAYTFYQLLIAALLIVALITIVGIIIFAVGMGIAHAVGSSEGNYNIYLEPYNLNILPDSSRIIRARKKDSRGEYLGGLNGEIFKHSYDDKYILLSGPDSSLENQLFRVVNY